MSVDHRNGTVRGLDVAVAHWRNPTPGGAVEVAIAIAETVDSDVIYTVDRPPESVRESFDGEFHDVLDDLSLTPFRRAQARLSRAFEYGLWEDVDWREYGAPDVLVTSGSTTRGVVVPDDTLHVNYCHSPPRWLYDLYHHRKGSTRGLLARPALRYLRTIDAAVDNRVDHYLANSPVVARRLWKYYDREAEVVYPPLDLGKYRDETAEEFYLHLGRLDGEKGVPAIVDAFEESDRRLVLAGGRGDTSKELVERIRAAPNMAYRGYVDEEEKYELLASCRAVVFNGVEEDFGIVPIEANASAKAALVPDGGFPGEFVHDGENGYTHDGTATGITDALSQFESVPVTPDPERVEPFARESFERELRGFLVDRYREFADRFPV